MRLYRKIIPSFSKGIIDHTGPQTMLYLTCSMISSVGLALYMSYRLGIYGLWYNFRNSDSLHITSWSPCPIYNNEVILSSPFRSFFKVSKVPRITVYSDAEVDLISFRPIFLLPILNPIALRTAKTLWSFGCSECRRVKHALVRGKFQ